MAKHLIYERGIFLGTVQSQKRTLERPKKHRAASKTGNIKHKNNRVSEKRESSVKNLKNSDRRFELLGIFLVMLSIISTCGIFGLNAGFVGFTLAKILRYLFGVGAFLSQAVLFLTGMYFILRHKTFALNARFFGYVLLFSMLLAFYHYLRTPTEGVGVGGGVLGSAIVSILKNFFGDIGSFIVIICGIMGACLLSTDWSLQKGLVFTKDKTFKGIGAGILAFLTFKKRMKEKRHKENDEEFIEAHLYNQAEDNAFAENAPKHESHSEEIVNLDETSLEQSISLEEIKSEDAEENIVKSDVTNEDLYANNTEDEQTEESIEETEGSAGEEVESAKETGENIEITEYSLKETEDNIEENKTEKVKDYLEKADADPSPAVIPPSQKIETGMDAAGFAVRADAFKSRDERVVYPDCNEDDLDLSEPDFGEGEKNSVNDLTEPTEIFNEENSAEKIVAAEFSDNEACAVSKNISHEDEEDLKPLPPKLYELPVVEHILSKRAKKQNLALKIEIEDNARTLAKTLEDFKVKANIKNACHGPAVTRYELEPAPGVKVSKITGLAEDLALALAATSVRIEPIPGKSAIGIEVPNKELEGVQLREVLERPEFLEAESKLTVGLGVDIGGQAIFADLAKMPHLLVAGATGSGKSVCINTIITGILFKAKPDEVKFILIDPKMVELSNYNGIPHLMVPVMTDAKKAASVLNWAVQEMEKRYSKFAEKVVRNMEAYNNKFPEDKMSAIVIIIDELADLMMVAPHDVEDAICRLAQKARAAGIHLVLATQRPSVDVITGIIKANIPSRIAFAVSSQIDSRTILDSSGAEKLLGKGDMLFYPIGSPKPRRVQGAFVSDEEVELLLDFIKSQGQAMEADEEIINFTERAMEEENDKSKGKKDDSPKVDELLADAVELVMTTGQASASNVQRRFRVGYARAGRLIDTMELLGIVGPSSGSKPREILMDSESAMKAVMSLQE